MDPKEIGWKKAYVAWKYPAIAAQLNEAEWAQAIKDIRPNQETEAFKGGWNCAIDEAAKVVQ